MTPEEFEQRQYELSIQAGANQHYHQSYEGHYRWWDTALKISVGLLAFLGAVAAILAGNYAGAWDAVSIFVAILAAVAAIALNLIPLGEWSSESRELFRRWTDQREDVDAIEFDFAGVVNDGLLDRLKQIGARAHRICGAESVANKAFFNQCCAEEEKVGMKRQNTVLARLEYRTDSRK